MTISSFLAAKAIAEKPTCLKFVLYRTISSAALVYSQHSAEVDMTNLVSTNCLTERDAPL